LDDIGDPGYPGGTVPAIDEGAYGPRYVPGGTATLVHGHNQLVGCPLIGLQKEGPEASLPGAGDAKLSYSAEKPIKAPRIVAVAYRPTLLRQKASLSSTATSSSTSFTISRSSSFTSIPPGIDIGSLHQEVFFTRPHSHTQHYSTLPQSGLDPYRILGLDRSASDEEIKKRYRELLHKLHPDTAGVEGTGFLLQMVLTAYETIKRERGWE